MTRRPGAGIARRYGIRGYGARKASAASISAYGTYSSTNYWQSDAGAISTTAPPALLVLARFNDMTTIQCPQQYGPGTSRGHYLQINSSAVTAFVVDGSTSLKAAAQTGLGSWAADGLVHAIGLGGAFASGSWTFSCYADKATPATVAVTGKTLPNGTDRFYAGVFNNLGSILRPFNGEILGIAVTFSTLTGAQWNTWLNDIKAAGDITEPSGNPLIYRWWASDFGSPTPANWASQSAINSQPLRQQGTVPAVDLGGSIPFAW